MRITTHATGLQDLLAPHDPQTLARPALGPVAVEALAGRAPPLPRQAAPAGAPPRPRPVDDEALKRLAERRIAERRQDIERLRDQARALPGMPVDKRPLAGYLLARHVDGRPVEGEDLARLDMANNTLLETRCSLRFGRGNVDVDIHRTGHESTRRVHVARNQAEAWSSAPERHPRIALAATALFVQAGNCGDHASLAVCLHAGRLRPGETANLVTPEEVDHEFVEIRTMDGRAHDVVVDAWGDGPAIMAEDGRFSSETPPPVLFAHASDVGPALAADLSQRLDDLIERRQIELQVHLQDLAHTGFQHPAEAVFTLTPVESDAFMQRVAKKMATRVKPGQARADRWTDTVSTLLQRGLGMHPKRDRMAAIRHDIIAAGIARSMGDEVRSAVEDAPAVVYEARNRLEHHGNG
ncbi:hypothetical protein ACFX58_17400 [Sphingomonas sp. NCPPB 2930]